MFAVVGIFLVHITTSVLNYVQAVGKKSLVIFLLFTAGQYELVSHETKIEVDEAQVGR